MTNKYNTWCILENDTIQSTENNLVLTYLGTVKCGALGNCGWQAIIYTFPSTYFPNQQIWEITYERTGFTSFKETLTTRNGATDRQGWLSAIDSEAVAFEITNENDVSAQWIVQRAPKC